MGEKAKGIQNGKGIIILVCMNW